MSSLETWLASQKKLAGAVGVELRHLGVADQSSRVQRWPWTNDVGSTCSEIWTAAQQWADGVGSGYQRFTVAIVDAKDQPLAQFMLRAACEAVGGVAYDSEPATLAGVTKQLMRHTEAIMRGSAASHAQIIDHLLGQYEAMSQRCERLESKHLELIELSEDLLSQRAGRDLATQRAMHSERRKDELLRKMGLLLPVIMAKVSGNDAPAQLDPAVRELAMSLDAQQLDKLGAALRPEQVIALTTILDKVSSSESVPASKPNGKARKTLREATHE